MSPRTGRPVGGEGRKDKLLQVRMDAKTLEQLNACAEKLNTSKSEAIRQAVQTLLDRLEKE